VIQEELPPLTELISDDILRKKCHINLGRIHNIYVSAALPPRIENRVTIWWEAGWAVEPVWTATAGNRAPAFLPVAFSIPIDLSRVENRWINDANWIQSLGTYFHSADDVRVNTSEYVSDMGRAHYGSWRTRNRETGFHSVAVRNVNIRG
jgi:hypothetical protein